MKRTIGYAARTSQEQWSNEVTARLCKGHTATGIDYVNYKQGSIARTQVDSRTSSGENYSSRSHYEQSD